MQYYFKPCLKMSLSYHDTFKKVITEDFPVEKSKTHYSYSDYLKSCIAKFEYYFEDVSYPYKNFSCFELNATIVNNEYDNVKKDLSIGGLTLIKHMDSLVCKRDYPIFNVDQNLLEMLINTKIPKTIKIERLMLDFFILLLPKNNSLNTESILFNHQAHEEKVYQISTEINSPLVLIPSFYKTNKEITLEEPPNDRTKFIINLLLWQQSIKQHEDKELIISQPLTKKQGFGKKSKEIIIPRILGTKTKPKVIREYATEKSHASPRTHWRSGHWRNHQYGSRKEPKYKHLWIEPVLING